MFWNEDFQIVNLTIVVSEFKIIFLKCLVAPKVIFKTNLIKLLSRFTFIPKTGMKDHYPKQDLVFLLC